MQAVLQPVPVPYVSVCSYLCETQNKISRKFEHFVRFAAQHILNSGEWVSVDMMVRFRDNYDDDELRGQEGTVKNVDTLVSNCSFSLFLLLLHKLMDYGISGGSLQRLFIRVRSRGNSIF